MYQKCLILMFIFSKLKRQFYIIKSCVIHNYNFPKRFHLQLAIWARLKHPKKTKDPHVLNKKLPSRLSNQKTLLKTGKKH